MTTDPFTHMEEAWGLDQNPFPGEGINSGEEHYSALVYPQEERDFRMKVVRGGLQGGRKMSFLWSISPTGEDTGFGKTTMMRILAKDINNDFGDEVQRSLNVREQRIVPIAAAFAELNEHSCNGLYPVLFQATQGMAAGPLAIFDDVRSMITAELGDDSADAIVRHVADHQLKVAPTGQALRSDLIWAFAEGGALGLAELLNHEVSDASRLRNGVQYFTGALYILGAAGIKKVFLLLDQLEDLGKKGALSAAKRRREIGRIRDLLEMEPFAAILHTSFTFHTAAAMNLEADWDANRLPSFDPSSSNAAAISVLRGIKEDDQARELLRAWMEPARVDPDPDSIEPFTDDVLAVLRTRSTGRPGKLLWAANELLQAGAEACVGVIDVDFARQHFAGAGALAGVGVTDIESGPDDDFDDLLA